MLGNITKGVGSFLTRTNESQNFKCKMKRKSCQFKVLLLPKDSNKTKEKEKKFSYKHQLRQFVSAEMRYKKMVKVFFPLKDFYQTENSYRTK